MIQASSILDGIPEDLSPLARTNELLKRTRAEGFDWGDPAKTLKKLAEEVGELQEAYASGDKKACLDELGDVLQAVAVVANYLGLDTEKALTGNTQKFELRYRFVEAALSEQGRKVSDASLPELIEIWNRAKGHPSSKASNPHPQPGLPGAARGQNP